MIFKTERSDGVFKGVAGLIVLGCSRCDAVIAGGGGVDLCDAADAS